MAESEFGIPDIPYFRAKNIFSGSLQGFNYKIWPKDEGLKAAVWVGPYCYEKSEEAASGVFPMDPSGRAELLRWLSEQRTALITAQ